MILGIHNWAELSSAVICTICLIYKPSVLNRWFVLFLWVTVVVELLGKVLVSMPGVKMVMYNIFNGVEFLFYLSFLHFLSKEKWMIRLSLFFLCIFFFYFSVNLLFIQGYYIYNSNTHTVGSVLLILSCLIKFIEIITSEASLFNEFKRVAMIVIIGILIFYAGSFTNTSLFNYQVKQNSQNAVRLYKLINHSLNVVLYGLFSIAFILEVGRKNNKVKTGQVGVV